MSEQGFFASNPTARVVLNAWALFVGLFLMMAALGLQNTLLGVRASLEDFPVIVTGVVMSGYSLGFIFGSQITPTLIRNVGHVRTFAALASLASTSVLIHGIFVEPITWTAMRVISGFCYAGLYIVVESWLNDQSDNNSRGGLLSVYMLTSYFGYAGGQSFLTLGDPSGITLFIIVSVGVSLAVIPMLLSASPAPRSEAPEKLSLKALYRTSPLGVLASFFSGMAIGGFGFMSAVYANRIGLSIGLVSAFVVASTIGSMVFQYPIGRLSDRFDRRKVILFVYAICAVIAFAGLATIQLGAEVQIVIAGLFGGFLYPAYSLAIAHTNDHLRPEQMIAGSAALVMVYGSGQVLGPFAASMLMDLLGAMGFYWYLVGICGFVALFTLYRMTRRAAVPLDEQGPHINLPGRSTPLTYAITEDWANEYEEAAGDNAGDGAGDGADVKKPASDELESKS